MRVERIGEATLYLGDCLDILPTVGPVDAVVTDPPFANMGATVTTGFAVQKWGRRWSEMVFHSRMTDMVLDAVPTAKTWHWFTDHVGHALFMPKFYDRFPTVQSIIWDKDMLGVGANYRKQTEMILYCRSADSAATPKTLRDLIRLRPNYSEKRHPTAKPVELMGELLKAAQPGITLDPFMGSGSTGVACVEAGRPFIGCEIEPLYFEVACERIAAAHAQGNLFA